MFSKLFFVVIGSFLFSEEIVLNGTSDSEQSDHPLNPNPESQWQSFFKDNEVLLQVNSFLFLFY